MIKRRRCKKCRALIYIAIILIIAVAFSVMAIKMHPVIVTHAVSVAETIMLNSANDAVIEILEAENISYEDIVNLSYNEDGYVTSLETDIYKVNFLKSRISNQISEIIAGREKYDFSIPIGSFLNNDFTNGFGPDLKFKMQVTTTAFVNFTNEFKAAGINQVLHIINVDIKIRGSLVISGYRKGIETKTSAIAAQTVIVGKTPDAFTNVVESEKDNTGGLINDYGAIAD